MPKIILKCRYLKHEKAHLAHLVRYIATREGVEMARDTHDHLPATARQKQLIDELLRSLPETQESYEYRDYQANPTMGNALAFISISIEQNMDLVAKKENYVDYIASRPGVEKRGTHGLFTDAGVPVILSRVQEEVARHEGNVWTFILSIRREDAVRLGYDDVKRWEALLRGKRMQMAEAMKMSPENLVWYAAFHQAGHHPHVHMIAYSHDPGKGFLTEKGIEQMRAMYAKEIFYHDMYEMYQNQTVQRNELVKASANPLKKLFGQDQGRWEESSKLEQLMTQLATDLKQTKGRKVYGYLPPRVKQQVDRIVNVLSTNPAVAERYQKWYEYRLEILHIYSDQTPDPPPLSKQKEFKQIKNMIIREAMELEVSGDCISEQPMDDVSQMIAGDMEITDETEFTDDVVADDDMSCIVEFLEDDYADWTDEYRQASNILYGTDGEKPDFVTAYQMMSSEAEQGNAFAMCDLGQMLHYGRGCEPDPEASQAWYNRALRIFLNAENVKENAYLEYRLGKLYYDDLYMEKNLGASVYWLNLGAGHGNKYAQYLLGKLYLFEPMVRDEESGIFWLQNCADQGNPYAVYLLEHKDEWGRIRLRSGVIRLFHYLSALFNEQENEDHNKMHEWIDRKRGRKLKEKKIAQGIRG